MLHLALLVVCIAMVLFQGSFFPAFVYFNYGHSFLQLQMCISIIILIQSAVSTSWSLNLLTVL